MRFVLAASLLLFAIVAHAAPTPSRLAPEEAPVLLLSDLHFDPFHDPARLATLRQEPIERWAAVLDAPETPREAEAFSRLQTACSARGVDSPWLLIRRSLAAAHTQISHPAFVTVSGDLLTHLFDCRYRQLAPGASASDVSAFAVKTVAFLALQLRQTFPRTPVYLTLGNNDSGCGDYREDAGSPFLRGTAPFLAEDAAGGHASRPAITPTGDYTLPLPAPMQGARLVVLQDTFESSHYANCDGSRSNAAAAEQLAWLRAQLTRAQAAGDHVWVLGHVPPGVDVYASFHRAVLFPASLCSLPAPQMFLDSPALADTLAAFPHTIRLAIFAHSHMDEIKFLSAAAPVRDGDASGTASAIGVPIKLVPSISPVNGNLPAFLVARVNTRTAVLQDYTSFVAADTNGSSWHRAYSFREAYGLPDFSAASASALTAELQHDRKGDDPHSRSYRHWLYAGDTGLYAFGLERVWPAYSCALTETSAASFHSCLCPANSPPSAPPRDATPRPSPPAALPKAPAVSGTATPPQ